MQAPMLHATNDINIDYSKDTDIVKIWRFGPSTSRQADAITYPRGSRVSKSTHVYVTQTCVLFMHVLIPPIDIYWKSWKTPFIKDNQRIDDPVIIFSF